MAGKGLPAGLARMGKSMACRRTWWHRWLDEASTLGWVTGMVPLRRHGGAVVGTVSALGIGQSRGQGRAIVLLVLGVHVLVVAC